MRLQVEACEMDSGTAVAALSFNKSSGHDGELISLHKPALGSLGEESPLQFAPGDDVASALKKASFAESVRKLGGASLTVSALERPSDGRRASAWLAGWNVTNVISQGTGILGVPYAVMMGGWASVAIIVIVAAICCYTGKLLVEFLYVESKRTGQLKRAYLNFPEVGEAAWPGWGNKIVSVVQVCEMYGGVIMYIVLLATVFSDIKQEKAPLDIYQWAVICVKLTRSITPKGLFSRY